MSTRTNNLVALGSAAVVAIYAAGFVQTREAAARFSEDGDVRRPLRPNDSERAPAPVDPEHAVDTATPRPAAAVTKESPATPPVTTPVAAPVRASVNATVSATGRTTTPNANEKKVVAQPAAVAVPVGDTAVVAPTVPQAIAQSVAPGAAVDTGAKSAAKDAPVVWKDGVYLGWGGSRHGDIQAEVTIRGGRIVSASIAQCLTRYSCSWIEALPAQVVVRQSPDVDYVSGATQSANAFYYAVSDALAKAK